MDFITILTQWWDAIAGEWTWVLFLAFISIVIGVKTQNTLASLFTYFFIGYLLSIIFPLPSIILWTINIAFVLFVIGLAYSILRNHSW